MQAARLAAAHRWWAAHHPQARLITTADPTAAAALAVSISIPREAVTQGLPSAVISTMPAGHTGANAISVPPSSLTHQFMGAFSRHAPVRSQSPGQACSTTMAASERGLRTKNAGGQLQPPVADNATTAPISRMGALRQMRKTKTTAASKAENGKPQQCSAVTYCPSNADQSGVLAPRGLARDFCPTSSLSDLQVTGMESSVRSHSVAAEVGAWARHRARLEEEFVRRQEASRFARPCLWQHEGTDATQAPAATSHSLCVYGGMTREQMDSLRMASSYRPHGNTDSGALSAPLDALRAIPGLMPNPGLAAAAAAERACAFAAYQQAVQQVQERLQQLGMPAAISAASLERALAPVSDKPYLQCMARLPRPGEHVPAAARSAKAGGAGLAGASSPRPRRAASNKSRPASSK